jgi:multifunctional beta-oxidation protein
VGNFGNTSGASHDGDDVPSIAEAKRAKIEPTHYTYTERDLILYNLSLGATEKELQWTFESDDQFAVIPTFGVIPQFPASSTISFDFLPDFNPVRLALSFTFFEETTDLFYQAKLLHGEQYLAIKAPLPTSGELVSQARLLEVLDKGKAAAVTTIVETRDKATGKLIFENQSTVFIRGSGGFGGKRDGQGAYNDIVLWHCPNADTRPWSCLSDEPSPQAGSGRCSRREDKHLTGCALPP